MSILRASACVTFADLIQLGASDILKEVHEKWQEMSGGGQNVERRNVERLKFRNFKVANIKITKDALFDSFIIEFILSFFRYYLNTQNI